MTPIDSVGPLKVKIKKLHPDAKIPTYAKSGDAGMDLTAISMEYNIGNETITYGFGLAFEIPDIHFMMIVPRSSIYKQDLYLTNHCGIVDSKYRGEVKAIFKIHRHPDYPNIVTNYQIGDKVAQAIILPYPKVEFELVNELSDTERGDNGFGSSGA